MMPVERSKGPGAARELSPQSSVPPAQAASRDSGAKARPKRAYVAAAAVAAVLLGGGLYYAKSKGGGEAAASADRPKRDVPRLDGRAIVFSPAFRDRAGVKLAPVSRTSLTPEVKVVGTVVFDPEHVAAVGTRIRGIVSKVMKVEGDPVKKGDSIAEIESAELGQAQADIAVAQAHRKAAELNAAREEELASKRLSTAREAEVARATLEEQKALLSAAQQRAAALGGATKGGFGTYVLRAPLDGSVVERHVAPGQSVENNVVAFRVANLDQLWVELAVFERDIGAVRQNDVVEITPLSDTSKKILGRVAHVGEVIDLNTRSAGVRVEVDNHARGLRPGQSVSALIRASGPAREGLALPQSAVTYVDGKPTVFVAENDTRVMPTEVELGAADGKSQEVLGGLREGQQVVVEGVFALKSELFRLRCWCKIMLARIVLASIRMRALMLTLLALLLGVGGWAAATLPIDAMPDVSTIQVSVLTTAPGLSPVEVERTVTVPIENGLNGVPGNVEIRSISRAGLSAVTVVFTDQTDVWFARQLVLERLRTIQADLPPTAQTPELAPVSTGLGEIYQFVVRSPSHSPMQLRTMLDWEIVPKLRSVPGVIEVNTMGGDLKQYQVVVDRGRLRAQRMSLEDVLGALRAANVNVGGGYIERRGEAFTIRGQGMLRGEGEIADVVVRSEADGTAVLVRHVADVRVGSALRYGVITHNGEGEAVTGIVMMLLGANSRDVVRAVADRVEEIRRELPPGVVIDVIYDRADFVGRTVSTVLHNLVEGVVIVTVVLALFLGTVRGALAVVIGIPAAMSIALLGMHYFKITGDLMSLGAIDFGFLVDGPIVILEAVMAGTAGRSLVGAARRREYVRVAGGVMRPVAFAVAIIMLVYVPLLSLEGVEGKMFRPMALTMACALFGALVYSVLFFPAVLTALVSPPKDHGPHWVEKLGEFYGRVAPWALSARWPLIGASTVALVVAGYVFAGAGADFVPRIFEGDAVVTIRRAPSIALDEARRLDLDTEKILHTYPEVLTSLGMTGRAEVAVDPVGNDNTDILVRLKPLDDWSTAHDFDDLSEVFKDRIESDVPGTFVSVSQPIEDKTNELISGSRADVSIKVFGPDLDELAKLSDAIGEEVKGVRGSGDVRIERVLGQPVISARADRARMARYGVKVEDAFAVLSASREGVRVGEIYEQQRRFDLRVLNPPSEPTAAAIGDLFVETAGGGTVPLREVVKLDEGDGPTSVRRQDRERTVRIDVNLRGRDLVSWVGEAKALVDQKFPMKAGYHVTWGGQFENFERAQKRLAVVVPVAVAIIFGMLFWMFQNLRFALAVFITVPFALTGGMLGLLARGLSFSLPAAVGFIALGGIAVLNGVVIATEVRRLLYEGVALDDAIARGTTAVVRAVLTTAAVAALGFLPMAIATSAGAEVQRPLATVVIVGILLGTLVTLLVLPGILKIALKGWDPFAAHDDEEPLSASAPSPAE